MIQRLDDTERMIRDVRADMVFIQEQLDLLRKLF